MIKTQNFVVKPNGSVKGGSASYSVDTVTGEINYAGQISVGVWFFSKNVSVQNKYTVDPSLLDSDALKKQGDTITLGNVVFTALSVNPGYTVVTLRVTGQSMTGTIILDTSGLIVGISKVNAVVGAPILGILQIEADPVVSLLSYFKFWMKKK